MLRIRRWDWIAVLLLGCGNDTPEPRDGTRAGAEPGDAQVARDVETQEPEGVDVEEPLPDADAAAGARADASLDASESDGWPAPARDAGPADAPDTGPGAATDAGALTDAAPPRPAPGCLAGSGDLKRRGPFKVSTAMFNELSEADTVAVRVQTWVPELPASCKAPLVHFARGTGATCSTYAPILEHLASHGFLATCHEIGTTEDGSRCLLALELAYQKYPTLADDKIASMGHAEGGAGAYACLQRAEEKWQHSKLLVGLAMFPDTGLGGDLLWQQRYAEIQSPVFQFHGTEGLLISESVVKRAFEALPDTTEAYWYEAQGAFDVKIATAWAQESALSFFRWKLLGDSDACRTFKQLPEGADWDAHAEQAATACPASEP